MTNKSRGSTKTLITGGAGCIGSDLAAALVDRGDDVTVLDNLSSGRTAHIEPLLDHDNFSFVQGDLLDRPSLDRAMQSVDIVYHLAANPDVKFTPGDPTDKDLQQNTIATYNVLESMRTQGVKRLAFSSTSAVYGMVEELPIAEDQTPRPISLYGASKLACEALIHAFGHLFEMQCWVFRFANIVGPKVRTRGRTVIGDFIAKLDDDPSRLLILGDGRQAKSYLRSDECVAAMLHVVDREQAPYSVYNLGCEDSISVNRIAELVIDELGLANVQFEYTGTAGGWAGDVPRFTLDVSAVNRLGWQAQHSSEQAIRYAIKHTLRQMQEAGSCKR